VPAFLRAFIFLTKDIGSPILARPVTGCEFRFCRAALMSGTKGFTALRVALLDSHLGVAVANNLFRTVLTRLNNKLLRAVWCAAGLVALHLRFIYCHLCHHKIYYLTVRHPKLIRVRIIGIPLIN